MTVFTYCIFKIKLCVYQGFGIKCYLTQVHFVIKLGLFSMILKMKIDLKKTTSSNSNYIDSDYQNFSYKELF